MERDQLFGLIRLVMVRDACTAAHTWRVMLYTRALAEHMNLEHDLIRRLMRGAALHDIGKVDLPRNLLAKPGRLTAEEFEWVKQHPTLGEKRLRALGESDPIVLELVRSHHERIDGSGYPDGRARRDIPVAAQLFAVIDSFDAMTSLRPYRHQVDSSSVSRALDELARCAGTWYDADAVERFADLVASRRVDWIQRLFNDRECFAMWSGPSSMREIEQIIARYGSMQRVTGGAAS